MTWMSLSLCRPPTKAHLLTTRKWAAVLPVAVVRPSMRAARCAFSVQLHGEAVDTPFSLSGKSEATIFQIFDGRWLYPFSLCRATQRSGTERAASPGHGAVQRVWVLPQQAETAVSGNAGNRSFESLWVQRHCCYFSWGGESIIDNCAKR